MSKKTTKPSKKRSPAAKFASHRSTMSGRFLTTSADVAEFKMAARSYTQANTASKQSARDALKKMGIITSTGALTKHYKSTTKP